MARSKGLANLMEKLWPSTDDVIGRPVYFEENGEQVGIVKDTIETADGKITGYHIEYNGATVQLPADNIKVTDNGLIFQPLWFTEYDKLVRQLEFEEKLNQDLAQILANRDISKDKLDALISKNEPRLKNLMEEAKGARKVLNQRKGEFELERYRLRREIGTLSEKRLLGEEGRREYAQKVLEAKRKASILDYNINRCNDLLLRLEKSPFVIKEKLELDVPKEKPAQNFQMAPIIPAGMPTFLFPEHAPIQQPPQMHSPIDNTKIKKFRVLKIETRVQNVEAKLQDIEDEMQKKLDSLKSSLKEELRAELDREALAEIDDEIKEIGKRIAEAKDEPKFADYLKKRQKTLEARKERIANRSPIDIPIRDEGMKPSGHICVACGAEIGDAEKCPSCGLSVSGLSNETPSAEKRTWDAKVGTIILLSGLGCAVAALLLLL